jgi:DNA-binding LytR/AlgR family response regulator
MSIRIVIADDDTLIRTGLRMILATQPDLEVVGEAADGRQPSASPGHCGEMLCSWMFRCRYWTVSVPQRQ